MAAPAVAPKPGTMFSTPGGSPTSSINSARRRRRQRRLLGRLEHRGVAASQRRGDLVGRHHERDIPRIDQRAHAHRLTQHVMKARGVGRVGRAVDLRRPPGVVAEDLGHLHGASAGRRQRRTVVEGLQDGQLLGVLFDRVGDLQQNAGAGVRRNPSPRWRFECATSRDHRGVDVGTVGLSHQGQPLFRSTD